MPLTGADRRRVAMLSGLLAAYREQGDRFQTTLADFQRAVRAAVSTRRDRLRPG